MTDWKQKCRVADGWNRRVQGSGLLWAAAGFPHLPGLLVVRTGSRPDPGCREATFVVLVGHFGSPREPRG